MHLLDAHYLLLDHLVLVESVLDLLRVARREVELFGLAEVVVRQTVEVHLVELLRLLSLHSRTVLVDGHHASHPIVLTLCDGSAG